MIRIDPEFERLIPPLSDEEFAALELSIMTEGCRDAIVVWQHDGDDIIVDGHNRYRICTAAGLPYNTVTRDFSGRSDVKLWMIRNQLARRNLNDGMRLKLAWQLRDMITEIAEESHKANGGDKKSADAKSASANWQTPIDKVETAKELGKIAESSTRNVYRYQYIRDNAPAELLERVHNGEITVNRAETFARELAKHPQPVIDLALRLADDNADKVDILASLHKSNGKDGSNGTFDEIATNGGFHYGDEMDEWCDFAADSVGQIKAALASVAKYHQALAYHNRQAEKLDARLETVSAIADTAAIEFIHGDCINELQRLPAQSVKLLLTDPPYGMSFQSNRRTASPQAPKIAHDDSVDAALSITAAMLGSLNHAMQSDCHVLMFCTWRHEYKFMTLLEEHGYTVAASLVWVKENHTSGDLSGFAPKHERIIHARRGRPEISPRIPDVLEVTRQYDTGHPTEKPVELLECLINVTTIAGELIVDPFAGTASTGIAALKTGRKSYLVEMDSQWHTVGKKRIDKHLLQPIGDGRKSIWQT